ncbi:hypothetical protein SPSYN_02958 [Sporotomaculum syntrophicum]|uniref:Uncharacterized protein n=1 Tax=Sporotomaculum syntrophicum TaxID=182264 RepID=A0A9D2WNL6_9FIRM|nr:hypothetical protein SPSYN_02958 [Sporotomaculum syntrophicum]
MIVCTFMCECFFRNVIIIREKYVPFWFVGFGELTIPHKGHTFLF